MQDPFVCFIGKLLVFGGVEVKEEKDGKLSYKTVFYKGKDIFSLERFTEGPKYMKDIRLVDLKEKIGVFTRPVGKEFLRGKIGFTIINNLSELTEENILKAKFICLFFFIAKSDFNFKFVLFMFPFFYIDAIYIKKMRQKPFL